MARNVDPDLARIMEVALGGVNERPRADPIAAAVRKEAAQETENQAATTEQATQDALAEKEALVEAIGTARDTISAASRSVAEASAQTPTAAELRDALGTTSAVHAAADRAATEQIKAGQPEAAVVASQTAERRQATRNLAQTVGAWGKQMGQVAEQINAVESRLRTAKTTLGDVAAEAPAALRTDFGRLQTAIQTTQDSMATVRHDLELMSSRAEFAAGYPPTPAGPSPDGGVLLGDTFTTEELTSDLAAELDERLGGVTPGAALDQLRSDLTTITSEIDALESRIGGSEPAAAPAAEHASPRAHGARASVHRGTQPTPGGSGRTL